MHESVQPALPPGAHAERQPEHADDILDHLVGGVQLEGVRAVLQRTEVVVRQRRPVA